MPCDWVSSDRNVDRGGWTAVNSGRASDPGPFLMESNPYAPPNAEILTPPTEVERIRQEHIQTESSIKTAGVLYRLAGAVLVGIGVVGLLNSSTPEDKAITACLIALGLFLFALGRGLERLRRWVRVPAIVLSIIGLLIVPPVGTLLNGVILANLIGRKATTVLRPEYQEIIAATPHVKPKQSKAALVVLVIILLGVLIWAKYFI
jgi:hypothetical protein